MPQFWNLSTFPWLSHSPTPLNDYFTSLLKTLVPLCIFSWWPCFLYIKNESNQKKTFSSLFASIPTLSAFSILLWSWVPFFLPLVLSPSPVKDIALPQYSTRAPACQWAASSPFCHFYLIIPNQGRDMLRYLPSLKQTNLPSTTFFFSYRFLKELFVVTSPSYLFWIHYIQVFFFFFFTLLLLTLPVSSLVIHSLVSSQS